MKRLINFLKQQQLKQLLSVVLAGFLLLTSVACNSGNVQGARPNNPPVQLGGNNNPHSMGGDGYTNYKMSTDPKVNKGDRADAGMLLLASNAQGNAGDIIYSGSKATNSQHPTIGPNRNRDLNAEVKEFPKQPQGSIGRTTPNATIRERVGESFKEASEFLKDDLDAASQRPEMKPNPVTSP